MADINITTGELRTKTTSIFALADSGERVIIRRRGKTSYMLTPVSKEEADISPELEKKIEEAREQYRRGETISCNTMEELHRFLASL